MSQNSHKGLWWLPTSKGTKIAGELIRTKNGTLKLHLAGSVSPPRSLFQELTENVPPILLHGINMSGTPITLVDCTGGLMHRASGYSSDEFRPAYGLIGVHVSNPEDLLFKKSTFAFSHLIDWLFRPTIMLEMSQDTPHRSFRLQFPEDLIFPLEEGELTISSTFNTEHDPHKRLLVHHDPYMEISHPSGLSVPDWLNTKLQALRDFLTFATYRRNDLLWMKVSSAALSHSENQLADIEVILPREFPTDSDQGTIDPHYQLFCVHDVPTPAADLFRAWFELYRELNNVITLYFGPRYNDHMYPQHEFLDLAQGLETYHRCRRPGETWPQEEYEEIRNRVLQPLQGKEHDWLERLLEFANEPSFRTRIKFLLSEFDEPMQMLAFDRKAFANKVTNTRNYYIHWNGSLRNQAATGEVLFRMTQVLQCLLESCLLAELAFDSQRIAALFKRNQTNCYTTSVLRDRPGLFN